MTRGSSRRVRRACAESAIRRAGRLPARSGPRLAQAVGVAMRKSVACLFAVGLPALALLAFFIQARSRDSSRGDSPPNALRPATDVKAAAKPVVKARPEISLGRFQQEGISIECSLTRIGGAERTGDAFCRRRRRSLSVSDYRRFGRSRDECLSRGVAAGAPRRFGNDPARWPSRRPSRWSMPASCRRPIWT